MSELVGNKEFAKEVCKAIGLDPSVVTRIEIVLEADESVVLVEVIMVADKKLLDVDWLSLKDANITINDDGGDSLLRRKIEAKIDDIMDSVDMVKNQHEEKALIGPYELYIKTIAVLSELLE